MKRILFALAALLLAVGTGYATTQAVWTDTVTVTNNQVVTGTADLRVYTVGPWDTSTAVSNFSVTNLVPSATETDGGFSFWLRNESTSPINFSLGARISASTGPTGGADESKLWLKVYNIDTPSEETLWYTLAQWKAAGVGGINLNSALNNATQKRYGIKVQLESSADDLWQAQTVNFTLEVVGTQV